MWLYNPEDADHEFGHMLGLGDAYSALYRYNQDAPEKAPDTKNEYGQQADYGVPLENTQKNVAGDIMRGYNTVSDTDLAMLFNAWKTGQPQYFYKDPKKVEATKREWLNKIADALAAGFKP